MDGLEATKIIKEELQVRTPVVALTADDTEVMKKMCNELNFDGFQGKPMKRDALKEILKQFTGYDVS